MKKLIFVLFLVLTGLSSEAQNDLTTQFSQWDKVPGARYIPSALDMKNEKVQIGIGGGFWLSNNFVNYDLFSNVIQNGGIDSITMSDFISKAGNKNNIIGAGLDGNLFQIAVKAKAGSKDLYILGGIASRTGLNLRVSETLLELAWKGNKQFAGKTVELGPFGVNAWTGTEYSLGLVGHNLVESGDFNLSVGGKLKLVTSSFALYMEDTKATMYTDPDGRFIDLNFNYNIKMAGVGNSNFPIFGRPAGKGIGFDLSATGKYKGVQFSLALVDIGKIKYTKDTREYAQSGLVHYEGYIYDYFFGGSQTEDSLNSIYTPNEREGFKFSMPLPTRFIASAQYGFGKEDEYDQHTVGFLFYQGFNQVPVSVKISNFNVFYTYNLKNIWRIGMSFTGGGYGKISAGIHSAVGVSKSICWGIGLENLPAFFSPSLGNGLALNSNLVIQIGRQK